MNENTRKILSLFDRPKVISLIGSVHSGKSLSFFDFYEKLASVARFSLYTYGFQTDIPGEQKVYGIEELEQISDSVIMLDEVNSLFDLDKRSNKAEVENFLRLIHHRNNVLLLGALPDTMKKFLSNKTDVFIFKKCVIGEFIQGSSAKKAVMGYSGSKEGIMRGTAVLSVPVDKALVYDGKHYDHLHIDYHAQYDTKAANKPIVELKEEVENE